MAKKTKTIQKECRSIGTAVRADGDSRIIEGLAIVFDKDSQNIGWIEQIVKGAVDEDTIKRSDIVATLNHNPLRGILARSRYGKGTLKLWIEDDGMHYRFQCPHTALGDETLEMLDRGDCFASSFEFSMDYNSTDDEEWIYDEAKGLPRRYIKRIDRLYDVSVVVEPAYLDTEATRRSAEEIANTIDQLNALQAEFDGLSNVDNILN